MADEKRFPIMGDVSPAHGLRLRGGTIPWHVAEQVYEEYARAFGRTQDLERIAVRGGFTLSECRMLLRLAEDAEVEGYVGHG